ncbi:MAG: hypothetical protein CM15mP62_33630 [Rhodospirillaceae bacterium]|nr:MAG: hypothetical protein CM15mP62_33630 [Rhodospirillaceae bacterium]
MRWINHPLGFGFLTNKIGSYLAMQKFYENMAVGGITIEEGLEWSQYIARLINAGIVIPPKGVEKKTLLKNVLKCVLQKGKRKYEARLTLQLFV